MALITRSIVEFRDPLRVAAISEASERRRSEDASKAGNFPGHPGGRASRLAGAASTRKGSIFDHPRYRRLSDPRHGKIVETCIGIGKTPTRARQQP